MKDLFCIGIISDLELGYYIYLVIYIECIGYFWKLFLYNNIVSILLGIDFMWFFCINDFYSFC